MTDTNDTDVTSSQADRSSDARLILGPLLKHAAIGLVLVSIILGTVVMVDRERSQIVREVAELEAMLTATPPMQDQQLSEDESTAKSVSVDSETVDTETATVADAAAPARPTTTTSGHTDTKEHTNKVIDPAVSAVAFEHAPDTDLEATTVEVQISAQGDSAAAHGNEPPSTTATELEATRQNAPVALTEHRNLATFDQDIADIIEESNAFLNDMDRLYLESYKASQDKQLEHMRERLARQEQRIKDMEARFKERYEIRADDLQEMRAFREDFSMDRI